MPKIVDTFAYHEHGDIPLEYVVCLRNLSARFTLGLVTDIWAPKDMWLKTLSFHGLIKTFSALSFSSDHGMVKPSPEPFELVVRELGFKKDKCLVIGDSIARDLAGAEKAGIECVLVNCVKCSPGISKFKSLLEFCEVTSLSN